MLPEWIASYREYVMNDCQLHTLRCFDPEHIEETIANVSLEIEGISPEKAADVIGCAEERTSNPDQVHFSEFLGGDYDFLEQGSGKDVMERLTAAVLLAQIKEYLIRIERARAAVNM